MLRCRKSLSNALTQLSETHKHNVPRKLTTAVVNIFSTRTDNGKTSFACVTEVHTAADLIMLVWQNCTQRQAILCLRDGRADNDMSCYVFVVLCMFMWQFSLCELHAESSNSFEVSNEQVGEQWPPSVDIALEQTFRKPLRKGNRTEKKTKQTYQVALAL